MADFTTVRDKEGNIKANLNWVTKSFSRYVRSKGIQDNTILIYDLYHNCN